MLNDLLQEQRVPSLTGQCVHVFFSPLDVTEDVVRLCRAVLNGEEENRAAKYRFDADRQNFIVSRGVLRHFLGAYTGLGPGDIVFGVGNKGKPYLLNNPKHISFNISHTKNAGLWAFAVGREIGVDIESPYRHVDVEQLAKRFLSEREWQDLQHFEGDAKRLAFLRCWTRKEAFVKALGDGLAHSLKTFDVSVGHRAELRRVPTCLGQKEWLIQSLNLENDYIGAVVVSGQAKISLYAL